jgi:hypothetical protein
MRVSFDSNSPFRQSSWFAESALTLLRVLVRPSCRPVRRGGDWVPISNLTPAILTEVEILARFGVSEFTII